MRTPSEEQSSGRPTLCVHSLGRFEVRVEQAVRASPGPREALLLQALIALGPESVAEERLAAALFPELPLPEAQREIDATLQRLRSWLGQPTLVVQRFGRLALDPAQSWVDVNAFVGAVRTLAHGSVPMILYQGRFLPDAGDAPWLAPIRERLHTRYLRYVAELAGATERRQAWDEAIAIYEAALCVDDLHEPFYQGILRCNLVQGKHREVMRIYERCEQRLARALPGLPDEHTRTLSRASFYADAPATKRQRALQ